MLNIQTMEYKEKNAFFPSILCHTMIKNLCVSAAPTGKYCNQYSSINLNRRQLKQEVKTCCKDVEATATASNTGQWKSKAEAGSTKATTGAFQHSSCPQGKIQIYTCISSVLFTKTCLWLQHTHVSGVRSRQFEDLEECMYACMHSPIDYTLAVAYFTVCHDTSSKVCALARLDKKNQSPI